MNKLEQAARQALNALETLDCGDSYKTHNAAATLREALSEPQITTPDVCGEVCARAKLCYGCNKDLEEANAKYAEQAEQEPVGYLYEYKSSGEIFSDVFTDDFETIEFNCGYNIRPLYAAPVRTKDLTDDEIAKAYLECEGYVIACCRAVIQEFRRKNGIV